MHQIYVMCVEMESKRLFIIDVHKKNSVQQSNNFIQNKTKKEKRFVERESERERTLAKNEYVI